MSNPFTGSGQNHNHEQYRQQQPYTDPAQNNFGQPYPPAQAPYPVAGYAQPGYPVLYAQKSKIAAALLAFFLGSLGVHNFYLGFSAKGGWQLGLTIFGWVTSFFLIGLPILFGVWLWSFIEFIMILAGGGNYRADANGVPLTS